MAKYSHSVSGYSSVRPCFSQHSVNPSTVGHDHTTRLVVPVPPNKCTVTVDFETPKDILGPIALSARRLLPNTAADHVISIPRNSPVLRWPPLIIHMYPPSSSRRTSTTLTTSPATRVCRSPSSPRLLTRQQDASGAQVSPRGGYHHLRLGDVVRIFVRMLRNDFLQDVEEAGILPERLWCRGQFGCHSDG